MLDTLLAKYFALNHIKSLLNENWDKSRDLYGELSSEIEQLYLARLYPLIRWRLVQKEPK